MPVPDRLEDRVAKTDPPRTVQRSIESRLFHAKPGDTIQLRKGTEALPFDEILGTTWRDAMNLLVAKGVVESDGNGHWVKKAERFGDMDATLPVLPSAMREAVNVRRKSMDLRDKEQRIAYMTERIGETARESHILHKTDRYDHLAGMLANAAEQCSETWFPVRPVGGSLAKELDALKGALAGGLLANQVPNENVQTLAYQWAVSIIHDLNAHPSNEKTQ